MVSALTVERTQRMKKLDTVGTLLRQLLCACKRRR